jgi:hypothetical protein
VQKNIEAVAKLEQKIAGMGILEKGAHAFTKYADMLSGGSIRGFVGGLLPRGAGYKVMNALDLEERLRKNLDIINAAINAPTSGGTVSALSSLDDLATNPAVTKAVTNHITTARQIVENTPADKLASMGGIPEVLSQTKTNIVDGLKASGMVDASEAISNLPVSNYSTVDALEKAIRSALSIK